MPSAQQVAAADPLQRAFPECRYFHSSKARRNGQLSKTLDVMWNPEVISIFVVIIGFAFYFIDAGRKKSEIRNSEIGYIFPSHGKAKVGLSVRRIGEKLLEFEVTDFYGISSESFDLKLGNSDLAALVLILRSDEPGMVGGSGVLSEGRIEVINNLSELHIGFYSYGWNSGITLSKAEAYNLADQFEKLLQL